MQTLHLTLPDFVDANPQDLSLILAAHLYEQGKLSIGQAAELAGLSKRTFMELLRRQGVSAFNYDASELEQDLNAIQHQMTVRPENWQAI